MLQKNAPLLATELKNEKYSSCLHLLSCQKKHGKDDSSEKWLRFYRRPPQKPQNNQDLLKNYLGSSEQNPSPFRPLFQQLREDLVHQVGQGVQGVPSLRWVLYLLLDPMDKNLL